MSETSAIAEAPSFETALTELEAAVHDLEEGRLGLAEAVACYERGVKLLKRCYGLLECAERKIELLTGVDAEGRPITKPFDDEASLARDQRGVGQNRRRGGTGEAS